MANAPGEPTVSGGGRPDGSAATSTSNANVAAWLLVLAFVGLVLSVAVPAMSHGTYAGWAALLFMFGMAATLGGTALTVTASVAKPRAVFGGLVMLVGIVLMFDIVPGIVALGVILLGVALEIGSLPAD